MEDILIKCVQCNREFVFSAGEQSFYQSRNFTYPKRCPECRKKRSDEKTSGGNTRERRASGPRGRDPLSV
ncbi:MAG: zinc-ribbon domain-containing protein [Deltaproteobacteria bacterium]|nr:zinc-ribbon domain-containing protein [Deltaproteobacteria bacterium]